MMENHKPIEVSTNSDRVYSSAGPRGSLARLAWAPIPLLLALIAGLWVADLRTVYESRAAMVLLNVGFSWLASLCICILTARSFLGAGQPGLLMFGCGSLIWGVTSLAAATVIGRDNTTVTIHNLGVLAAALCHLLGLLWRNRRLPRAGRWLLVGYASALAASAVIFWAAMAGLTPTFFVQGHGGTPIRQLVLLLAVASFAWVSWRILYSFRRQPGAFYYWYGLGLALFATGLTGVILLSVQGGVLGWTNRLTQYLGSAYLLIAALKAARKPGTWMFSAAAVEEGWRENMFLAGLRQRSAFGWILRYGLAALTPAAANALRGTMESWVGPSLPTYITFYPAVMIVAVLAGFGPGIAATAFAAVMTALWILPPIGQFYIASPADRLALMVFVGMGLSMSAIAALYRRNRDKAAAYDSEKALRESQELFQVMFTDSGVGQGQADPATGRILRVNAAFCRIVGYSEEELRRRTFLELHHPDDRAATIAAYEAMVRGETRGYHHEKRYLRADGSVVWVDVDTNLIRDPAGRPWRSFTVVQDIGARKQAEAELERMRALLAEGQKIAHVGSFEYVADTKTTVWSEEEYRIYGLDPAGPSPTYEAMLAQCISPDDARRLHDTFVRAMQSGGVYELEHRIVRPDGSVRFVYDRAHPRFDEKGELVRYVGATLDITERKQAEQALRQLNAELEQRVADRTAELTQAVDGVRAERRRLYDVLETLPVYVTLLDADYRVPFANRFFEERFGKSEGRRCYEYLFGRGEPCENCETYKVLKTGRPHHWYWTGPDQRDYDIHDFPFTDTDGSKMILEMGIDITDRNRAEAALKELNETLERRIAERTAELARSNEDLEQFAYAASHDLQEPLRMVNGFLKLLEDRYGRQLDEKAREYIRYAVDGAARMLKLIRDLLEYSRVGRQSKGVEPTNADAALASALANLSDTIREAGATVTHDELPTVTADSMQLMQLLQNLIGNAIKFRREGARPRIHVSAKKGSGDRVQGSGDSGRG